MTGTIGQQGGKGNPAVSDTPPTARSHSSDSGKC